MNDHSGYETLAHKINNRTIIFAVEHGDARARDYLDSRIEKLTNPICEAAIRHTYGIGAERSGLEEVAEAHGVELRRVTIAHSIAIRQLKYLVEVDPYEIS